MKKFSLPKLPNKVSRALNKANFKIKKHSPEILVTAGVVGTVASTVLACKATLKLGEILDESKHTIDQIHEYGEKGLENYTKEDVNRDLYIVYVQTAVKVAKLYSPALILGGLSITSIFASNNILRKRNVALAAAYTTIDNSFKEYRKRVVDRFGEEVDHQIRHNIKVHEIEETVVDENGNETTVKKEVEVSELDGYSDYARFFDEASPYWEKDPEYSLMFLRAQQNYANDKLRANGYLFLNDVYEMLGIPKTKAGQMVGWVYDEKNPVGDNYVDFGIYDTNRAVNRDFVNGYERVILLDFNVDGNIWNQM